MLSSACKPDDGILVTPFGPFQYRAVSDEGQSDLFLRVTTRQEASLEIILPDRVRVSYGKLVYPIDRSVINTMHGPILIHIVVRHT